MKSNKYYVLLVVTIILTALSFDVAIPTLIDTSEKTEIEISLLDNADETEDKMLVPTTNILIKAMPFSTSIALGSIIKNQRYLNKIFKPPKQA